MADVYMRIMLSAIGGAGVTSIMQSVANSIGSGNGVVGALGAVGLAAGATAIGLGVVATKAAGDFQSGLTTLVTGAGEAQSNIKMVGDGILKMANDTGTSTKQLVDGMYMIESAGYHGAAGLDVLKNAAMGAKVGAADLGTVANGVTTIMTDFSSKNVNAANATNALIATVASGKTHMQDLSQSLSTILPTASAAGVGLNDVMAAMATMTGEGVPAADAATYLRQTIMMLENPSSKAAKTMKEFGLTAEDIANEMKVSLPGALKMVTDAVGKQFPAGSQQYIAAVANIVGGTKSMQGILDLTGSHMDTFNANVGNISNAVKKGGNSIAGWSEVQKDFNFQFSRFQEIGETLLITVGNKLLPVVSDFFQHVVIPGAQWLLDLFNGATDLSGAFKKLGVDSGILYDIGMTTGTIFRELGGTLERIGGFLKTTFAPALDAARDAFKSLVTSGVGPLHDVLLNTANDMVYFKTGMGPIADFLKSIKEPLHEVAVAWGNMIKAVAPLVGALIGLFVHIAKVIAPMMPSLLKIWVQFETGIMGVVTKVAPVITQKLIPAIEKLVDAIAPVVKAIIDWIAQSGIISIIFDILGTTLSLVITIISTIIDVIATVISIFTHWGDTTKAVGGFFSDLWKHIQGVFGAIGKWFEDRWHDVEKVFSGIGAWFHDRWNEAWHAITEVFAGIGKWFADRWQDVVNGFKWLYDHNYYFKDLVDFIRNAIAGVIKWITDRWHELVKNTEDAWKNVSNAVRDKFHEAVKFVHDVWSAISQFFVNAWNNWIVGPLTSLWKNVSTFFANAWTNWIVKPLTDLWTNVSTFFAGVWNNYVAKPIGDLWTSLSNTVSGWANSAFQWGVNLINGLVNGIASVAGNVGKKAQDIAGDIAKFLGFHSPAAAGPGAELDQWPKNMIATYAKGLQAAIPMLQSSLNLVMQPIASTLGGGGTSQTATPSLVPARQTGGTITHTQVFNISISTMARSQSEVSRLVDMVEAEIAARFRANTAGYSSGGIY
jgi:TP901 family phage tail tape measure protein